MLTNPRHEAFAVLVAGGVRPSEAYTRVGFSKKGAAPSATRLASRPSVAARIAELNRGASESTGQGFLNRAVRDRDYVIDLLKRNAQAALEAEDHAAVNRAAELLGKELGMFREKQVPQLPWDGDLRKLSMPQLEKMLASMESMTAEAEADDAAALALESVADKGPVQ